MTALRAKLEGWIGERYPLASIRQFLAEQTGKRLPVQTSWWHTIGSLLLFLTVNQIVTGILLMVYYRPAPETAFESVHHIMTRSHFGWLIRGLHAWGATLMILLLVAHMLRTFITGSFKKPRELTWVSGVVIFCLVLVFGFTGYLLPWNQTSYWGTTVGTEISGAIPAIGGTLRFLSRGGDAVGGETLARYYVVHVAVLPWILVAFVGMHLFLVRLHGIATLDPVGREQAPSAARGVRFFPEHVAKEALVFSVFFAIFVAIVFLAPIELGERADPFRSPPGIKPEWYFAYVSSPQVFPEDAGRASFGRSIRRALLLAVPRSICGKTSATPALESAGRRGRADTRAWLRSARIPFGANGELVRYADRI